MATTVRREVTLADFYRINGRLTQNRERLRALLARRVAQYVRLVAQTAADRDAGLRDQIKYWRGEARRWQFEAERKRRRQND